MPLLEIPTFKIVPPQSATHWGLFAEGAFTSPDISGVATFPFGRFVDKGWCSPIVATR